MKHAFAVRATLASTLFACASLAVAAEPETMVVSGAAANRIVGLWSTEAEVKPCGTDIPPSPIRNTLLFQAGGTIVENPLFPSGGIEGAAGVPGVYQRSQALGTWSYNPKTGRYWIHLQFDNFIDADLRRCGCRRPLRPDDEQGHEDPGTGFGDAICR